MAGVDSGTFPGNGDAELFEREIGRLAKRNQLPLPGGDLRSDGRNLRGNAQRDGLDTVQVAVQQLTEYLSGKRKHFHVTLVHVPATPFQLEVWEALNEIPFGEVRTYAEVAEAIGRPRAMRAIGNANHVNPWPVIVPCHRVVARHGIGGYGGGIDVKRFLLELEGVTYD